MATDPNEIKKLLKEIEIIYKRLGEKNPWEGIKEASVDINKLKKDLNEAKDYLSLMNESSDRLVSAFRAINEEISSSNKLYNVGARSLGGITSISSKLRDSQQKINTLSSDQVKTLQKKLESETKNLEEVQEQLKKKSELSEKEKALLTNINGLLGEQDSALQSLTSTLQEELQTRKKIEKSVGITGKFLKGISKIPIIGNLIDTSKILEEVNEAAENGAGKWKTFSIAIKGVGKSLMTSLSDPLVIMGLLIKGFKTFVEIGFRADKEITNLSKSMASSKEEAATLRDRFIEIQNSGGSLFETTQNLVASQLELADAFGVTRGFSEAQLKDQILLTKQMGFQAEEFAGIQQLALSNGMTVREVTGSVIKQTAALSRQKGIQLDNKKIIGEVAKVSGQLRLQYANNPKLIAAAVVQTNQLGISLENAKKMAEGLLNFEQSIEDELSAELLTGKNLNLERARALALNGDSAAAVKEMARQVGTAADFTKMNVIQQEALAKAVGMSSDELANSLITQENLAKLGKETRKQLEEKAEALRAEGKIGEANQLLASAGDEMQAQAALERIDAQTTFNQSIETLKSMLSSIVEGPAADFVGWFGDAEKGASRLKGLFENIKTTIAIVAGIITGRIVFGLAASVTSMIAQVTLSRKLKAATQQQAAAEGILTALKVTGAEASTLGLATPLILGGLAAVMAGVGAYSMMNDGIISPTGGMVVSGPEGSIQLNKKDSIIAGTNLGGGGGQGNNSSNELRELKNMIMAIANRPINVSIDGEKVIKATTGANPNTDSDEMNKNSFRTQ
jgi:hypothetical protein